MTDRLKTVYPPKTSFCGGYKNSQDRCGNIGIPLHFSAVFSNFFRFNYKQKSNDLSIVEKSHIILLRESFDTNFNTLGVWLLRCKSFCRYSRLFDSIFH